MKPLTLAIYGFLFSSSLFASPKNNCQQQANILADSLTEQFQKIVKIENDSTKPDLESNNNIQGNPLNNNHISCDGVQSTCLVSPSALMGKDFKTVDIFNFAIGKADSFHKIEDFEFYYVDIESRDGYSDDYWEREHYLFIFKRTEFNGITSCLLSGIHNVDQTTREMRTSRNRNTELTNKSEQLNILNRELKNISNLLQ